MQIRENDDGGQTVLVEPVDHLDAVPESHQDLITAELEAMFEDPPGTMWQMIRRCPFPNLAAWLTALVEGDEWALLLHRGADPEWAAAGFVWWSEQVRSGELGPPAHERSSGLPPTLERYYQVVDEVRWMPFPYGGGLYDCSPHEPLSEYLPQVTDDEIEPDQAFVFGSSPAGNLLFYTTDDRGGWADPETGDIERLGTIEQTIEWVYARLLANECPEFEGRA